MINLYQVHTHSTHTDGVERRQLTKLGKWPWNKPMLWMIHGTKLGSFYDKSLPGQLK